MHPCIPPPPITGTPSTCIGDTVLYMYSKSNNCTKMQEAKLEFVYVHRGGCVGVAQISILCKTNLNLCMCTGVVCGCCSNLHFV